MNTTRTFLYKLLDMGVQLWDDDGYLGYRGPDEVLTPALMAQLKERKAEILRFLQGTQNDPLLSPILSVPRNGHLPLSFAQQRLWFMDQLGSGIAYNMPIGLNLSGPLNVVALRSALHQIVQRHESLRTTFAMHEDIPIQVIHSEMTVDLPVVDLSTYSPEQQALEVKRLSDAEATRPFDLSRDLMLRATLLRLRDKKHILLLTLHHIASDGWSLGVLVRELAALYEAFSQARPSPLPELPIQYADFAVWQRDYLQGQVLERQLGYWKERLAGAPELLQLPSDRPRPAQQSFRGDVVPFEIEAELTSGLRRLSQEQGATLYMTLLAAFQVLISRYTGQTDVVIASPIANRNRQEIEPLVGFFVNTLAMRANLSSGDGQPLTVSQLLAQVKETTEAAYDHQDLPFERLIKELQLERNINYNPLVQVLFTLQNVAMGEFHLPGLTVTPAEVGVQTTRFDLELHVWEVENQLQGYCIYSTDLFDKGTIERMMGHFQTLLVGMVSDRKQLITELPLLTEAEYHQIVHEWNDTTVDFAEPQTIHALFEQQVTRTPDAIALVFKDKQLTYQELNRRANQLAHHLIELGVGNPPSGSAHHALGSVVGVATERSIEMIIGILGILKAGAAYLPIDITTPKKRIEYLLQDSQAGVLLTTKQLADHFAFDHITQVHLDTLELASQPIINPITDVKPDSAAYLIYTSGSTGQPKGVLMPHRALWNLFQWQRKELPQPARTLQLSTISFDVACQELFSCWHSGGTLLLVEEYMRRDLLALLNFITDSAAERVFMPYVLFNALAGQATTSKVLPTSLRDIITAGEQLILTPAITQLMTQLPDTTLHNQYGPTESHVVTSYTLENDAPRKRGDESWPVWVPIGRAIDNVRIYILDDRQTPVPIGVPGELYIGGEQLAHGYLKRPDLTAERFIEHSEFARLYKTGDLCRWLSNPEGTPNVEFIGRTDFQVKIRGFRIELGEIENALLALDGVREAVVLARDAERNLGDKRLVAYLVGDSDTDTLRVRQRLAQRLPEYMIPSAFVKLDAMPLTPNGKLDRRALPAPNPIPSTAPYAPPRSAAEQKIAAVWEQLLNRTELSIYDSFFNLGGHSLLVIQAHQQLQRDYPSLKVVDLFSYPTIHGLAGYLEQTATGIDEPTGQNPQKQVSQTRGAKRRARQAAHQRLRRKRRTTS